MGISRKDRLDSVYRILLTAPAADRKTLLRCMEEGYVLPATCNPAVTAAYKVLQNLPDRDIERIISFLNGTIYTPRHTNPEKEARDLMDTLGYKKAIYTDALSHYKIPGEKGNLRNIVDGAYPGLFSELKEKGLVAGHGTNISLTPKGEYLLNLLTASDS